MDTQHQSLYQTVISCLLSATSAFLMLRSAHAEYTARDFFKRAPADIFYTDDEMSEGDKAKVINENFKKRKVFNCSTWGVSSETPRGLTLKYCSDSEVRIQIFQGKEPHDHIVAIESVRGVGGQGSSIELFRVKQQGDITLLTAEESASVGVANVTENDFLAAADKFPPQDAQNAHLSINQDGSLYYFLSTWMDPRWEHRQERFKVSLTWDGQRFHKVITATQPDVPTINDGSEKSTLP